MYKTNKPIIWILWWMWPFASLRCYELLLNESIKVSNWIKNDDFPHIIIDNIPVKELTNNLNNLNETILFVKNEYLRLKKSWVNIFIMACNTMHLYYKDIFKDDIKVTNLSLINETINQVKLDWHKIIGVLGTVTTIKSWLYWKELLKNWIKDVYIEDNIILEQVNDIIIKIIWWVRKIDEYEINILKKCVILLKNKWATGIILWCTELPIAFDLLKVDIKLYDPLLLTIKKGCELYYM